MLEFKTSPQVLGEQKIPPWTEIVLVPRTGKASLYPGLFLFTTPCRMVRPVQNLAHGKQELIGTFEQVGGKFKKDVCGCRKRSNSPSMPPCLSCT